MQRLSVLLNFSLSRLRCAMHVNCQLATLKKGQTRDNAYSSNQKQHERRACSLAARLPRAQRLRMCAREKEYIRVCMIRFYTVSYVFYTILYCLYVVL